MPRYLIAILPPADILHEVIRFQQQIEQKFHATHAQKVPPHITIIPPFECEAEKLEVFIPALQAFLHKKTQQVIEIRLNGFQHFASRTLFISCDKNEAFDFFCKAIKQLFNQQKIIKQREEKHFFIPHITLANKDLKKSDFKIVWAYFKNMSYERSFQLNAITILQYDGNRWKTDQTLNF